MKMMTYNDGVWDVEPMGASAPDTRSESAEKMKQDWAAMRRERERLYEQITDPKMRASAVKN